ncbi:hypothetical protein [Moraxella oblonga]|uniref:hypothetical protein n=1 Tax=Moraxella oblonga TaxID=200413 RepID=UPI0008363799|nr:hypothetical protein [Moraxella oblonga]
MSNINTVFNDKIPMPKLLADFLQWADQFDYGQLGYFEFESDTLDDNWIENGSQLANQFAIWLRLGDGSMIGFWRPEHFNDDILPVVLLGSEGEVEVLGESLEDFLYKWGNDGDFENVYDLMPNGDDDTEYKHHLLLEWLNDNNITCPKVDNPIKTEQLQQFFDDWQSKNA